MRTPLRAAVKGSIRPSFPVAATSDCLGNYIGPQFIVPVLCDYRLKGRAS